MYTEQGMAGCLDRVECASCMDCVEQMDLPNHRNSIASVVSGFFFFVGWWIMFDCSCAYPMNDEMPHAVHVCGIVSTLAFSMINAVSNSQVRGDAYNTEGCIGSTGARVWLFFGFLLGFSALIASCWILFGMFVVPQKSKMWPGVAVFLQNLFIFLGGLIFKFGRSEELWQ